MNYGKWHQRMRKSGRNCWIPGKIHIRWLLFAVCRELGYEIYEMDLITAGEEFYATMRRSTNGGGENSPKLEGEDDFYELFFASLEQKS